MQVNISIRHGQLTAESQAKIAAKTEKLARFHERLTAADVTIDLENSETPRVEVRVSAEKTPDFLAVDQSGSLMNSVDSTLHKLEQQLRKHKEKLTDHRNRGRRAVQDVEREDEGEE